MFQYIYREEKKEERRRGGEEKKEEEKERRRRRRIDDIIDYMYLYCGGGCTFNTPWRMLNTQLLKLSLSVIYFHKKIIKVNNR